MDIYILILNIELLYLIFIFYLIIINKYICIGVNWLCFFYIFSVTVSCQDVSVTFRMNMPESIKLKSISTDIYPYASDCRTTFLLISIKKV